MKICPMGAELLHGDGWTDGQRDGRIDMMNLTVAIRNFANATKNLVLLVMVGRSN